MQCVNDPAKGTKKTVLTAITHFAQQKAELIFDGNEIDTLIMSDQAILHS